jgi:hypothetical protein
VEQKRVEQKRVEQKRVEQKRVEQKRVNPKRKLVPRLPAPKKRNKRLCDDRKLMFITPATLSRRWRFFVVSSLPSI